MRNTLLFLCVWATGTLSMAQEAVPVGVQSALYDFHPTAEDAFWEQREGAYVANFVTDGDFTKVFFDKDGRWLETRTRLTLSEMPKAVTAFIDRHYEDADISYTGKVERPDGQTTYRVESETPSAIIIKTISQTGRLLEEKRIAFRPLEPQIPELMPYPEERDDTPEPEEK